MRSADASRDGAQPEAAFLLGAPRSGTSLMYKALSLHPDAAWISNWVQRYPALPQLAALNRVARHLPAARQVVWFGAEGDNAYVYGRRRPTRHRVFPMPAEGETLYRRSGTPEAADAGTAIAWDDLTLGRRLRTIAHWGGGHVVVSKRIGNNRRVPFLHQVAPRARFVEIVRDGRAVALSLSKVDWWPDLMVWWAGTTPRAWARDGRDPWELCARHWVEEVRILREGLSVVPSDQVLRLSYEQVVGDPIRHLTAVAEFIGLDAANPAWQKDLRRLRYPNKNRGWQETLPADVAGTIAHHQATELRRQGYEVSVGGAPRGTPSGWSAGD